MKVHYLFYWHEALRHPEVERTRVPIRYDPFNIGVVYAYVHGQWVPCHSQYYAAFVGIRKRSWRWQRRCCANKPG